MDTLATPIMLPTIADADIASVATPKTQPALPGAARMGYALASAFFACFGVSGTRAGRAREKGFTACGDASMTESRGVVARIAIQGGAHFGSAACGFVATLIMVRALGVDGFGYAALGLSVLGYALVFSSFGAELHATQVTAHDHASVGRNLTAVIAIRAALSVPTLLVIFALCVSGVWEPGARLAVALFSLSVLINIGFPLWAAQALERAPAIAACTFGGQLLNLGFVALAAWFGAGIAAYAAAKLGADLVVAVGLTIWLRTKAGVRRMPVAPGFIRQFFRDSAPLGVSQVLRSLALGSDLLILSFFVSGTVVGLYAVPYRIFLLLLSVSSVYFVVVLPGFARSAKAGTAALRATLRQLQRLPLPLFVAGLAVIAVTATPMLRLLFGAEFAAGRPALLVLLVAIALNFLNRSYRLVVLVSGQRVGDMRSTTLATGIGIAAKFVLIPLFGPVGAAAGTAISELVLAVAQRRLALRAISGSVT